MKWRTAFAESFTCIFQILNGKLFSFRNFPLFVSATCLESVALSCSDLFNAEGRQMNPGDNFIAAVEMSSESEQGEV